LLLASVKGIDWERENEREGICSERVKVGGMVGLIGAERGREELDERKREQDEYSTRKGGYEVRARAESKTCIA
jgi:hypothetical protein